MKTINVTFTDAEFKRLVDCKWRFRVLNWRDFIMRAARALHNK